MPKPDRAALFAALGDNTRLTLIAALRHGEPRSIAQLTAGSEITRQAITKHLNVLERTRLVRYTRNGRENLYQLNVKPLKNLAAYLDQVSSQWERTLLNLKSFVEKG